MGTKVKELGRRVRVLVADDHPVIRRMVSSTLEAHPHLEVCGEAKNGAEAIEEAKKLKPDVVVLNVMMPVKNGFVAAREIRSSLPGEAIVILSSNADHDSLRKPRSWVCGRTWQKPRRVRGW
jgi:DNA-binding NarL/FixJ family response regulator